MLLFFWYRLSLESLPGQQKHNERLPFYKRLFPPGTMSFTIPNNGIDHAMIQGVKIYIIRGWDMNYPEIFLSCCFCKHGELVPMTWDFMKNKKLTPVFDVSVPTKWVAAMRCKCKCCEKLVAGNDGNSIRKPPFHGRHCYPTDSAYAGPGKFHLSQGTSCLL
jgi:hypothetical protein